MSNLIGQTIGNYRIAEMVGRGGMGSVYRAQHLTLEREVAIKFLAQNLSGDEEFIQRFLREARLVARLDHPNIVRVFDGGEFDGTPYLVMELLEGETLRQKIKRGPLSEAESISIGAAVLSGLGKAHALKVVHRDIKPANIFLCKDGTVKVMDFGIAKAATEARLTGTGTQMGTPEYMSPEQAEGTSVDGRSDLYSVGIMLYEMLTGEVPFTADTPLSVLHMQVSKPVPALPSRISEWLRRLVECALAKNPSARFATAEEMREALLSKKMPLKQAVSDLDLDFSAGPQRSTREQRREASRVESGVSGAQSGLSGVVEGSRQAPAQPVASLAAVSTSDAKSLAPTSIAPAGGAQAGLSASSGAEGVEKKRQEAGVDRGRTNMMALVGGGFCAIVVLIVLIIGAAIHFAQSDDSKTVHPATTDSSQTSSGRSAQTSVPTTPQHPSGGPATEMADEAFHIYTRGKLADAQAKAREAISQDTNNANAHAALGMALAEDFQMSGNVAERTEAQTELNTALKLDANSARTWAGLATFNIAIRNMPTALTDVTQATKLDSKMAYNYDIFGVIETELGKASVAETSYKLALEMDSGMAWVRTNLAFLYLGQKRYPEAAASARAEVQNGTAIDQTYYLLGLADYYQHEMPGAETAIGEAIRMNPKVGVYHADLAAVLHYENRDPEARQEALQARRLGVTNHWIFKTLGV